MNSICIKNINSMAATKEKSRICLEKDVAPFQSQNSMLIPKLSTSSTGAELRQDGTVIKIECIPEVVLKSEEETACIEESIQSNFLYNCYQCNYATNDLTNFTDHICIHRYVCNFCSYTSFDKSSFELHKEIHFNVKLNKNLVQCKHEDFVKDEFLLFNTDIPISTGESIPSNLLYNCYQCDYATNNVRNFTDHTFIHRLNCDLCSYASFDKSSFELHKEVHLKVQSNKNLDQDNQTHVKCDFCNYFSNSLKKLRKHLRIHSELSCNKCDYKCRNKVAMTYHIRRHINEKYLKCDFCDYCSDQSSKLKKHFKCKHSGEKHFSCGQCDYICRRKTDLNYHKKSHIRTLGILNKVHQEFMKNKNKLNFL